MIYGKKPSSDLLIDLETEIEPLTNNVDKSTTGGDSSSVKSKTFSEKLSGAFNEIIKIYGPASLRRKALICHFTWCVTSLTCKFCIGLYSAMIRIYAIISCQYLTFHFPLLRLHARIECQKFQIKYLRLHRADGQCRYTRLHRIDLRAQVVDASSLTVQPVRTGRCIFAGCEFRAARH